MKDLVVTGIAAGVLGTIAMDLLNILFSRAGLILRIDITMIGRMSAGWSRGRFYYSHPGEMEPAANEQAIGYISHYLIGVCLAVPFVVGWGAIVEGPVSPAWIFAYGIATTVASVLVVYPLMGLGLFGRRSPEGIRGPLSSLANHIFFGAGMAASVVIV